MANLELSVTFASGVVESATSARVICQIATGDKEIPAVARWNGPNAKWNLFPMKWEPVRLAFVDSPQPCLFALAGNGTVGFGYGGYSEEQIDLTVEGPKGRGPLRDLRVIGKSLFAAGIARQVYRRTPDGKWGRFDNGTVSPLGELRPLGFTSIDGVSEQDVWAVGYAGEIWSCAAGKWMQHDSPTNVLLYRVRVLSSDRAYACGQKGVLLGWSGAAWKEVATADEGATLWGMEFFGGNLYVASENVLYRLRDNSLERVTVDGVATFAHLHAADGIMWSFGLHDLAWTQDGVRWNRVSPVLP